MEYTVQLAGGRDREQTDETVVVTFADGRCERVRLHDYARVYDIPGLYDHVLEQRLLCDSPSLLADMLIAGIAAPLPASAARVLDLGAGTGAMGAALRARGVDVVVGLDKIAAARDAAAALHPGVYLEYLVGDADNVTRLAATVRQRELNCLTCASALGANHIPASSFAALWDRFAPGSTFAINVNEKLAGPDASAIGRYLQTLRAPRSQTKIAGWQRFRHRVSVNGKPIHYVAITAHKTAG